MNTSCKSGAQTYNFGNIATGDKLWCGSGWIADAVNAAPASAISVFIDVFIPAAIKVWYGSIKVT